MCLVLIAHQMSEQTPLMVLANRDEFYNRPSSAATHWDECPELLAGRDLVSGGSWFGVRNNRWATVTNFREGLRDKENHGNKSRGWLVRDYLQGNLSPDEFINSIATIKHDYAGFNLVLGDPKGIWYTSNRTESKKLLAPGVYGLSNHQLDTPWPKVVRARQGVIQLLGQSDFNREAAFTILADCSRAPDVDLPKTGVSLEWERALSAIFITMPEYGTRCSTLFMARADNQHLFAERRFTRGPLQWEESLFSWSADGSLLDR